MNQSRVTGHRADPPITAPAAEPSARPGAPGPELRARRVAAAHEPQPGPVYVRADGVRAAQDGVDAVKSRFGWAAEWAKSAGKFGLGVAALTGVVAAVGHFTGADVPSAISLLFNGALVAVAYKPLEWGGAALTRLAGRAVSATKAKIAEVAKHRAEAAERRAAATMRTRGPELFDDVAGPAAAAAPAGAPLSEDVLAAIQELAQQDYVAMNPGMPPPEVTPEAAGQYAGVIAAEAAAGNPEVQAVVEHIRQHVARRRAERAAAAPVDAAPAEAPPDVPAAQRPEDAAPPPRSRRARRRDRATEGTQAAPATRPVAEGPPVQGEGAGYRIVDDTDRRQARA